MTTCSTVQIDSMPTLSAVVTRWVNRSGWLKGPELANIKPIFIGATSRVGFAVNLARGGKGMEMDYPRVVALLAGIARSTKISHFTFERRHSNSDQVE